MRCRMANEGLPVGRLREYLRELKPAARAMLMAELERGRLRGDDMPAADLVLRELRSAASQANALAPRIGDPQRLFFAPLGPFLLDDWPDRKPQGRVRRASLDPIWRWIGGDLMPIEVADYSDHVKPLLL